MSTPLLRLSGVNKSYAGKHVLSDINLDVYDGEFIAVIGYSGTGKTSLINILAGLTTADSGTVTLEDQPILGPGPDRSVVFQNYSLLPWMTVRENIDLAVDQVFPQWSPDERKQHVTKHINMVKLGPAAEKLPRELSGGMRQRVSVARALSLNSRILLLDEPLSALDALTRATLQDEISEIWQRNRSTVFWITNDPDEALLLADRVIPLLPSSPATLGAPIAVPIPRPRDRRTITSDLAFKTLRLELVQTLLSSKKAATASGVQEKPQRPDILPEDLTRVNTLQFFNRRGPRRRADLVSSAEVPSAEAEPLPHNTTV